MMVPMVKFPESHRLRSQSHRSDAYCLYGKLHERCTCLETTLKILPRLQGSYELLRLELVLCNYLFRACSWSRTACTRCNALLTDLYHTSTDLWEIFTLSSKVNIYFLIFESLYPPNVPSLCALKGHESTEGPG